MFTDVLDPVKKIAKEKLITEFFKTHSYHKKNVVDELFTDQPYDFSPPWQERFLKAMQYSLRHHYAHSNFYRKLCEYKDYDPASLRTFEDIWNIPFVLSDVFKMYNVETRTNEFIKEDMSSSGTSGRKSRIVIDILSGHRLMHSIYHTSKALGLADTQGANYLMMGYDPSLDETLGTTVSDIMLSYLTPQQSIFYTLGLVEEGRIGFLRDKTVEKLKQFVSEGRPIRILGFIHYICEAIKAYNERYGKLELPERSYIISGGGWKSAGSPYGAAFNFHEFLRENTNIDLRNVRDLYTLIEHEVFYTECEHHNMHIPNVVMVCARDPRNMERLGYGEKGLIHLYSPVIESCPTLSLLTTDYGYIGERCTCPIGGPYLKIIGRAGVTKKITCAFTADQYIERSAKK